MAQSQQQQQPAKALQALLHLCPSAATSANEIQTLFPQLQPSTVKNVAFDCGIDVIISLCRSSLLMEDANKRTFVCCRWNEHPLLNGVFRSPWSGLWQRALDPRTTTKEQCLADEGEVNKIVFDAESSKSFLGSTQRLLGSREEILRGWELSLNDTLRRFVDMYYTSAMRGALLDKSESSKGSSACSCAFVKDVTESAKANALQQLTLTQESMAVIEVQVMIVVEAASKDTQVTTHRRSLFEDDEDTSTPPAPLTPRCVVIHTFLLDFKAPRAGGSTVPTLRMLHDASMRIQNTGVSGSVDASEQSNQITMGPVSLEEYIRTTFVSARRSAANSGRGKFSANHQWSYRESRRYEGLSHRRTEGKSDGSGGAGDFDVDDALDPVVQADPLKLTEHVINAVQLVENSALQLLVDAAIPMMTSQLGPSVGIADETRLRDEAALFAGARAELSTLASKRRPPPSAAVV